MAVYQVIYFYMTTSDIKTHLLSVDNLLTALYMTIFHISTEQVWGGAMQCPASGPGEIKKPNIETACSCCYPLKNFHRGEFPQPLTCRAELKDA